MSRLRRSAALGYGFAVLLALLATVLQFAIRAILGNQEDTGSYQLFLGAVALSAVCAGRRAAFLALACCALLKLYFFLPPYYSLQIHSAATLLRLILFVGIGIVICLVGGALYASQSILSSTLGSIGDAVVTTDHKQIVRYMNPVAASLSGWQPSEAVGRSIQAVLRFADGDTLAPNRLPIEEALRQGTVVYIPDNSVLIARNGQAIPVEDSIVPIPRPSGQPAGAVMVFRDVTAQRRAERALRESEDRYRFLLDVMPDLIFTADARGEWDFCSRLWCDFTGTPPESCLGIGWIAALHPEDVVRTTSTWAECVRTGRVYEAEYRLRAGDGSFRWFLARAYPKRDDTGAILRWVGICTDVEDSKRTQAQLSQALKMEAVGRLAGGVAHELNNRLTVILGYASALTGDVRRTDLLQVGMEQILSAAHRSAALTRQLLTISRHQVVYPRLLDLNAVFHDMKAVLRRLLGGDIVLRDALAPDLLPVRIDRDQVEQLIVNLAINARDAMPAGGRLVFETANVTLDEPYTRTHVNVRPGRYVMLAVSDSGRGMDEETSSHIFEPFFTTKGAETGAGLGLSTVYGIVQQSGGHIATFSELERGTTFRIYLPAADSEAPLSSGVAGRPTPWSIKS